jgi:hypothetical protein
MSGNPKGVTTKWGEIVIFKKQLCTAFLIFAGCASVPAVANDGRLLGMLDGTYRFTSTAACIESTGGFNPGKMLEPLGGTTVYNEYLTGTTTFDGHGSAQVSSTGTTMFDGPFFPLNSPVGTFVSTCTYSYVVNPDLSFSMGGTCTSQLPVGPAHDQTATVIGLRLAGYLSRNGDILVVSGVEPVEQDLSLTGGYTAKRLCGSSGTYFKVGR